MTSEKQNTFKINAKERNLTDLDFPECAEKFKKIISDEVLIKTSILELDLRWCVVIYSQAHVFFDFCFSYLESISHEPKKLIILTTDNYLTRELTCYELFRTSQIVQLSDSDPKKVTSRVDSYCLEQKVDVEIIVYSGDTEDSRTPEIKTYKFPERENQ